MASIVHGRSDSPGHCGHEATANARQNSLGYPAGLVNHDSIYPPLYRTSNAYLYMAYHLLRLPIYSIRVSTRPHLCQHPADIGTNLVRRQSVRDYLKASAPGVGYPCMASIRHPALFSAFCVRISAIRLWAAQNRRRVRTSIWLDERVWCAYAAAVSKCVAL